MKPHKKPVDVKALTAQVLSITARQLETLGVIDLFGKEAYNGGTQYDEAKALALNYIRLGAATQSDKGAKSR